jgi:phosphoribosylamine--glycine ligase
MITNEGPKLVEYNCRFGDPECQVLMPRLKSDLLGALLAAREGRLTALEWSDEVAMTVVMSSKGYPGSYEKGHVITGLDEAASLPGVTLFHAGTERRGSGIVAVGGRVLNVTATGLTIAEARNRAYAAVEKIHWQGSFFRKDIGWRALNR